MRCKSGRRGGCCAATVRQMQNGRQRACNRGEAPLLTVVHSADIRALLSVCEVDLKGVRVHSADFVYRAGVA